jgi:hypothetical protein
MHGQNIKGLYHEVALTDKPRSLHGHVTSQQPITEGVTPPLKFRSCIISLFFVDCKKLYRIFENATR